MLNSKNKILHRYLSNGMELYLHPSDFAPIVSLQVLVKVGSIDEEDHEGGVAHVLEHMLFKGTKKYPQIGQIASTVELEGGDINAYTSFDHTNYHLTAPASFAKKGAELLLDVVQNSILEEDELKRELEVVIEEIRRSRDNPNALVSHNLFSLFYNETRMARPVIGYQNVVENFSRDTVYEFYKKWYTPNNMIFIASGDFDSEELFQYIEELSKEFPPKSVPERYRPPVEKLNKNNPNIKVSRGPWQEARVQLATPAPTLDQFDMPIWDVFASILGESDSSRLSRILREEMQLVTSIDCSCYTPKYPKGMLGVGFFGLAKNAQHALKVIVQEIRRLAEVPPTREEVNRVLNTLKAQRLYAQESVDGISRTAGMSLQTSQKMEFETMYMNKVSNVTPQDLQIIAQKIVEQLEQGDFHISIALSDNALSDIKDMDFINTVLHSANMTHHIQAPLEQSLQKSNSPDFNKDGWISNYNLLLSKTNDAVKQIKIDLPHGKTLKINYRESKRLPLASGMLVFRGGITLEPKDKNGIAGLTASMLTRGTLRQNYRKFIEELEDNASSISAFSTRDLFGLRFDSISENSLRTAQMMLDCLFRPEFSNTEWNRTHKETLEVLIAQKDNPTARLARISQPMLFPNHPYALPGIGSEQSIAGIKIEDSKLFWSELFHAKEFIFSIAGDFDLRSFINLFESEFKTFFEEQYTLKDSKIPKQVTLPSANSSMVGFDEIKREQAHIALSFRSFAIDDPRRTALELAATILAGQGGRLFLDLRDKRSLAYAVSASQTPNVLGGIFTAYIATSAHKAKEAIIGLKSHIENLANNPPSLDELKRAQRSVLGSQSIDSQHHNYQASQLAMSDIFGLGFDNFLRFSERVNAVTPDMISSVLRSLMSENAPVVAVVGPNETWVPTEKDPVLKWELH